MKLLALLLLLTSLFTGVAYSSSHQASGTLGESQTKAADSSEDEIVATPDYETTQLDEEDNEDLVEYDDDDMI